MSSELPVSAFAASVLGPESPPVLSPASGVDVIVPSSLTESFALASCKLDACLLSGVSCERVGMVSALSFESGDNSSSAFLLSESSTFLEDASSRLPAGPTASTCSCTAMSAAPLLASSTPTSCSS